MGNEITFLIGNGLGMALDKDYFTLKTGLDSAWSDFTNNKIKKIIKELKN